MLSLDETASDMFVLVKEVSLRHSRYYFATQTRANLQLASDAASAVRAQHAMMYMFRIS